MTDREIYEWLNTKNYQTEYEETGEYEMYFRVDMPKILRDFLEYSKNQRTTVTMRNTQSLKAGQPTDQEMSKAINAILDCIDAGTDRRAILIRVGKIVNALGLTE